MKKKDSKMNIVHAYSNIRWVLSYIVRFTPALFIIEIIRIVMSVYSTYIDTNIARFVFEGVENNEIHATFLLIIVIFSVNILANFFLALMAIKVEPLIHIKLTSKIREDVIRKAKKIKYSCFQSQAFYNTYTLGLNEIDSRAIQVVNTISSILSSLCGFITVCIITSSINYYFALFGIVYVLIDTSLGIKRKQYEYQKSVDYTPDARKRGYVNRIVYQPEFAADQKIYPMFLHLLLDKYQHATTSVTNIISSYQKKIFRVDQCQQIPGVLLKLMIPWILIVILLSKHLITIPEATVLLASVFTLPQNLGAFVNAVSMLHWHSINIDKMRDIFNQPEESTGLFDVNTANDVRLTPLNIEIKDASFSYQSNNLFSIKKINMCIRHGEKIAIVGQNGAGKTSLVHLLVRLYDLDHGSIKINTVDIRHIDMDVLRSKITLLSQNYVIYSFTIAENILMRPLETDNDIDMIWSALEKVGLKDRIKALPEGIHTYISQEFSSDGVYFSGGECQKLALARIYAGQYECIILDEATSSIDPISENEIYDTIFRIFHDKTIIMISHRLATITHVDRIYYLKNGQVAEEGTHIELMAQKGEYYGFFNAQAEKYKQ